MLEPEDYADNNAPILTALQYAGLRDLGASNLPAVVANPWVVPPNDPANGNFPERMNLATYGQVGSVWGTAFDRAQNAAYMSATYKRISDLGPIGLGGIYRITQVLDEDGELNVRPQVPSRSGWTSGRSPTKTATRSTSAQREQR